MTYFFLGLFLGGFLVWLACYAFAKKISQALIQEKKPKEKHKDEADWWKPPPDDEYWNEN